MKRLLLLLLILSIQGWATTLWLKDAYPANTKTVNGSTGGTGIGGCVNGTNTLFFRLAENSQGSATVSQVFAPTATAPSCWVQTASGGGEYLRWISAPLSGAVTISSNINYSAGCAGSQNTLRAGLRFVVRRWSVKEGSSRSSKPVRIQAQCATTLGLVTIAAAAPTSTAMSIGDRVVIDVEVRNVGGAWGGNSTRTFTLGYGGTAGGTGDTFANFVDTLSFSAESNNARAIPAFLVLPRLFNLNLWPW